MTPAQVLIEKLQRQREAWCDLGDGKRVRFRRPPEVEVGALVRGVMVEHAVKYAVGWEGFTEATLLGDGIGAADQVVEFHPAVWGEWIADHGDALVKFANDLVTACNQHHAKKQAALGNSQPTSTA